MRVDVEALQQVPLFHDLTQEELELVWAITIERSYRRKTYIFTEGSNKEAVYFIREGLVKAFKTDQNGNEHIVSFLKAGDMFPHTGFFNDQPYPATAEAILETKLLAIPVQSFEAMVASSPVITVKLMRVMSSKIEELQGKLQQLTGHDVNNRGLSFLINLAENYGTWRDGSLYIEVPMTNQDFANTIGTTRETVNRLINQLRKEGLLETHRKGYIILDYEALKRWTHN